MASPLAGDIREPLAVLVVGIGDDALDVLHHRKSERIGIEAGEARVVELGLEHDVGVRLQEFEEIAVRQIRPCSCSRFMMR